VRPGARFPRLASGRPVGVACLLFGLWLGMPVMAEPASANGGAAAAGGPGWVTLTPAQQSALAPLKRDWNGIDALRKQKWLEIAARFPAMPAEERQRVQERMTEWARMTPEERGRARLQFQEVRQISPQDRQARWDAYLSLPVEERRALAKSATTVPPAPKLPRSDAAGRLAPGPDAAPKQKSNVVDSPSKPVTAVVVAPTVVQAKPGATTTLVTKTATPPAHARLGEPKIAASQDMVDRRTLLPQTGAQSGPTPAPAAAPGSAAR
jgi:hypothetical protein